MKSLFFIFILLGSNVLAQSVVKDFVSYCNGKSKLKKLDILSRVEKEILAIDPIEKRKKDIVDSGIMSKPKRATLSIMINCFDSLHLEDTLQSIIAQKTNFIYEIVCIMHTNNQNVFNIINTYQSKCRNLLFFALSSQDVGNINAGMAYLNGEVILSLFPGDVVPPLMLQRLANKYLEERPDIIYFSNVISVGDGELTAVPSHSMYYTSIEMGRHFHNFFNISKSNIWGIGQTFRAFSLSSWCNAGGFAGLGNFNFNLGLRQLLKGYDFSVLPNSFSYKYYSGPNWYEEVMSPNIDDQIGIIRSDFVELLDASKLNARSSISSFSDLPWLDSDILKLVFKAFSFETKGDWGGACSSYIDAIKLGANHKKIYLRLIRSALISSTDNLNALGKVLENVQ